MNKILRGLLIVAFLSSTGNGFAMRCNGALIDEGDRIARVEQVCGVPESATPDTLTYRFDSGEIDTITIVNGRVAHIDFSR